MPTIHRSRENQAFCSLTGERVKPSRDDYTHDCTLGAEGDQSAKRNLSRILVVYRTAYYSTTCSQPIHTRYNGPNDKSDQQRRHHNQRLYTFIVTCHSCCGCFVNRLCPVLYLILRVPQSSKIMPPSCINRLKSYHRVCKNNKRTGA